MKWIETRVVFDSENLEDAKHKIADIFYEFGVQGVKIDEPSEKNALDYYSDEKLFMTNEYAVTGYFPINPYIEGKKRVFKEKLEIVCESTETVAEVYFEEVDDTEWNEAWKKYFYPERVGDKIVVKPTWREYEKEEGDIVIEIDPGMAFGTGTHPTTSLCISTLERYVKSGDTVLDVGTGSGILMIAADKLGASRVEGIDIDEAAVEVAIRNLELNGVTSDRYRVVKGNLVDGMKDKKFDIVVPNILAEIILILLKDIKSVLKDSGTVIFSGILGIKKEMVLTAMKENGFITEEVESKGEWVSIAGRLL